MNLSVQVQGQVFGEKKADGRKVVDPSGVGRLGPEVRIAAQDEVVFRLRRGCVSRAVHPGAGQGNFIGKLGVGGWG